MVFFVLFCFSFNSGPFLLLLLEYFTESSVFQNTRSRSLLSWMLINETQTQCMPERKVTKGYSNKLNTISRNAAPHNIPFLKPVGSVFALFFPASVLEKISLKSVL